MATYRCPECGASHKEKEEFCRLCGAPIANPVTYRTATIDKSIAAEKFQPKGVGHFALIGVAVALVLGLGAIALGIVDGGDEVNQVRGELPSLGRADDAWFEWADPAEVMVIEVPARPEKVDDPDAVDAAGTDVVAWTTSIGDTTFLFGHTSGLDFEDADDLQAATEQLEESAEIMAENLGGTTIGVGETFELGDHFAADASYQGVSLPSGPAFGNARFVLADGELYFIATKDYPRDSEAHDRMAGSLAIVSDFPDMTIPTIPPDAPDAGGDVSES